MLDTLLFSKGLPSNPDAERFMLGSAMVDPERFGEIAAALEREDFTTEANRRIWDAMTDLHAKGSDISSVTLAHELKARGQLESVGGVGYLVTLDDGVPRLPNLDSYIRILQGESRARKVIEVCSAAIERVYTGGDRQEIAAWCETTLRALNTQTASTGSMKHAAEVIGEIGIQGFLSPNTAEANAIPVPLRSLARNVPFWRPGQLVITASRPGKGKSVFLAQIAMEAARSGRGVAVYSLEMSAVELLRRMVVGAANVDGHKLTLGRLTEVERHGLQSATSEISESPIWLDDTGGRTVSAIDKSLRKLRAQTDIGLLVIDYLQLLNATGRRENRTQEISEISRSLKLLAVEHGIPVVVAAQINRAGATEVPDLHHLRDGGSIEADADVVIILHSKEEDANQPILPTRFIVRKHRAGPVGSCELLFHRAFTKFVEPERQAR